MNEPHLFFTIFGAMLGAAFLTGCQPAPPSVSGAPEPKVELTTPVHSPQRQRECAANWGGPSTKETAECLSGKKYTNSEFCVFAGQTLSNEYVNDWQKAALYEKMRNHGCMN